MLENIKGILADAQNENKGIFFKRLESVAKFYPNNKQEIQFSQALAESINYLNHETHAIVECKHDDKDSKVISDVSIFKEGERDPVRIEVKFYYPKDLVADKSKTSGSVSESPLYPKRDRAALIKDIYEKEADISILVIQERSFAGAKGGALYKGRNSLDGVAGIDLGEDFASKTLEFIFDAENIGKEKKPDTYSYMVKIPGVDFEPTYHISVIDCQEFKSLSI
jgi:hypothetical protein